MFFTKWAITKNKRLDKNQKISKMFTLYFLSNSFLIKAAISFSILNFSKA